MPSASFDYIVETVIILLELVITSGSIASG